MPKYEVHKKSGKVIIEAKTLKGAVIKARRGYKNATMVCRINSPNGHEYEHYYL